MNYARHVIFSNSNTVIEHVKTDRPTTHLVITFSEYGNQNIAGDGFGGNFLLKNGFDIVAVKTKNYNWYTDFLSDHAHYVVDFLSRTASHYTHRSGYGSSMGGYAAVKFSGVLGLDRVLAISPQFDISQSWDTRWKHAVDFTDTWPVPKPEDLATGAKYYIIFDPHNKDETHYKLYADLIPSHLIFGVAVPLSGHPAGTVLRDTGILQTTVRSILGNGVIDADWRRLMRAGRTKSARYFHNLAEICLEHRKITWAETTARRSTLLDPFNAEFHARLALIFEKQGNWAAMFTSAAAAAAANPQHPHMAAMLARALSKQGMKREALHHVDRACQLSQNPYFLRLKEDLAAS